MGPCTIYFQVVTGLSLPMITPTSWLLARHSQTKLPAAASTASETRSARPPGLSNPPPSPPAQGASALDNVAAAIVPDATHIAAVVDALIADAEIAPLHP